MLALSAAQAQTFTPLTPTTCPTSSSGLFTTGQQYVDANNGVLPNSWSMLVRWQGNPTVGPTQWISDPLYYNAGYWTGYTPPAPYYLWQRGYQPESQAAGTPGVQLNCFNAGMVLNSWYTPHAGQSVSGGGFNDMYGYAWGPGYQPWAFKTFRGIDWVPSELVLQGNLAVPAVQGFVGALQADGAYAFTPDNNVHDSGAFGHAQYSLFAYIADMSHPSLHPIAILAGVFENSITTPTYSCPQYGNVFWDYAVNSSELGVWAGSTGICNTDITTVRYTGGYTTGTPSSTAAFYRIHITPQNLTNLINRINSLRCDPGQANSCNCQPGVTCPQIGYSTDPNSYRLQYMGVLAETVTCDKNPTTGNVFCSTNLRDSSKPGYNPGQDANIGMAARASGVSAYAYTAN